MKNKDLRKHTGVVCILRRPSGEMLMQFRAPDDKKFPNTWVFPGGGREGDEKYISTAIREMEEEFEIKLKEPDCELITIYTVQDLVEDNHVFVCKVAQDQNPVMHEGVDMKWMEMEEIESLSLGYKQSEVVLPKLKEFLLKRGEL